MASPIDIIKKTKEAFELTETVYENHKGNFVELRIFKNGNMYAYGYKLKIESVIKQRHPSTNDFTHENVISAKTKAKNEIIQKCTENKKAKEAIAEFTKIAYNQLELF
ncbi:MAG: hypothetical protein ACTTKC_05065 [Treponema sp.]|uniref:hypothetical protein n=1 Tax=Treponema sp. TaxID=166 RepID=UPI003FA30504